MQLPIAVRLLAVSGTGSRVQVSSEERNQQNCHSESTETNDANLQRYKKVNVNKRVVLPVGCVWLFLSEAG